MLLMGSALDVESYRVETPDRGMQRPRDTETVADSTNGSVEEEDSARPERIIRAEAGLRL